MTAHYLLPCSCGQKVRIAVAQAGGEVGCVCGKRLPVPTLRGIRQLEVASDVPTKAAPVWTRFHGAIFAGGLVLAVLGLAIMALYGYRYAQISGYTIDYSADVIKEMSAQLDQITPTQALEMWRTEILEEGLGEPHSPPWVAAKARVNEYLWWIKCGGLALALGVIMSTAAMIVGRR
jgi:hypothetical protein